MILRRSMTAFGTLAIALMTLAMPSYGTTPGARTSSHSPESKSERLCFRDATSPPQPVPMPRPTRLLRTISLQWNGSIVLAPAPASVGGVVQLPGALRATSTEAISQVQHHVATLRADTSQLWLSTSSHLGPSVPSYSHRPQKTNEPGRSAPPFLPVNRGASRSGPTKAARCASISDNVLTSI